MTPLEEKQYLADWARSIIASGDGNELYEEAWMILRLLDENNRLARCVHANQIGENYE